MRCAREGLAQLEKLATSDADLCEADLLGQVTDLFFATAGQHSDHDVASFGDVMERLAYTLDLDPRAAFARRIADAAKASPRLLRRLATDDIAVAEPVLTRSQSLSEQDLEEIAGTCEPDHLLALSRRPSVPPDLADVIVTRGDRKALVALAGNAGLVLSRRGFTQLLRRAETIRELQGIIDRRGVVGADMVTRLWLRMTGWKSAEEPAEIATPAPEDEPAPEPPAHRRGRAGGPRPGCGGAIGGAGGGTGRGAVRGQCRAARGRAGERRSCRGRVPVLLERDGPAHGRAPAARGGAAAVLRLLQGA